MVVWAMVELEADDALASAAAVVEEDPAVEQVLLCTPDKDLAQCVVGDRVVQLDRRRRGAGRGRWWAKFGVAPRSIPDWLALVGDSADGFPGVSGWGKRSASVVLARYGQIGAIPADSADWDPEVLRALRGAERLASRSVEDKDTRLLFRDLATLRVERSLLTGVGELEWRGPTPRSSSCARSWLPPVSPSALRLWPAERAQPVLRLYPMPGAVLSSLPDGSCSFCRSRWTYAWRYWASPV